MGLDFTKSQAATTAAPMTINMGTPTVQNEIQPVENYDIVADRNQMNQQ